MQSATERRQDVLYYISIARRTTAKRLCTTQKAPTQRSSIRKCSRWCAWRCSDAKMKKSQRSAAADSPASTHSAVCWYVVNAGINSAGMCGQSELE